MKRPSVPSRRLGSLLGRHRDGCLKRQPRRRIAANGWQNRLLARTRWPKRLFSANRRQGRVFAARMGMWALMMQILLPLGQGIPVSSAADGPVRTLIICSAYGGQRTIPVPGQAIPTSSRTQSLCPVCMSYAAGGHLTLPMLAPTPLPRMLVLARVDQLSLSVFEPMRPGLPQPRAPPLVG